MGGRNIWIDKYKTFDGCCAAVYKVLGVIKVSDKNKGLQTYMGWPYQDYTCETTARYEWSQYTLKCNNEVMYRYQAVSTEAPTPSSGCIISRPGSFDEQARFLIRRSSRVMMMLILAQSVYQGWLYLHHVHVVRIIGSFPTVQLLVRYCCYTG